jgi:gliding motility-associated lipoprotein GldH
LAKTALPVSTNQKGVVIRIKTETATETKTRIKTETGKKIKTMRRLICCFFASILFASCNTNIVKSEYQSLENGVWNKDTVLQFSLAKMDTVKKHDIYINVRNDNSFPYSNLFLIASITTPEGQVTKDTLEYDMSLPDGTWLGKGSGSIKENKLWYKENIVFSSSGVYTIEVSQAMRKNGNVSGIISLEGITDVGIEVTKSTP